MQNKKLPYYKFGSKLFTLHITGCYREAPVKAGALTASSATAPMYMIYIYI